MPTRQVTIETVKRSGAEDALFKMVASLLWDAKRCCEHAGESSNGHHYTQFEKKAKEAIAKLEEAQKFFWELERMRGKR